MIVLIAAVPAAGVDPGDIVVNSIGMKLAYIPRGDFTMGSPKSEPGRLADETQSQVAFANGLRIGASEVTQEQWRLIMGTNPAFFKGDGLPVERVTWREAVEFCQRLSEKEKKRYRLPTQAEWEYACRAGTTTVYYSGRNEKGADTPGSPVVDMITPREPIAAHRGVQDGVDPSAATAIPVTLWQGPATPSLPSIGLGVGLAHAAVRNIR